jgi:hypothetical protein
MALQDHHRGAASTGVTGRSPGSPASRRCAAPFASGGTVHSVAIDVSGDGAAAATLRTGMARR